MKTNLRNMILGTALYFGAVGMSGCATTTQQRIDSFDQNYGTCITELMQRNPEECRRVAIKYTTTAVRTGTITPEQLYNLLTPQEQNACTRRWAQNRTPRDIDGVLGGAYSSARELNQRASIDDSIMNTRMPSMSDDQTEAYKKAREIVESHLQQN